MTIYRLAGQHFFLPFFGSGLEPFVENKEAACEVADSFRSLFPERKDLHLISRTSGCVGNVQRILEVYQAARGLWLNVDGCGEYLILPSEELILLQPVQAEWRDCDRDVILGPALVLALALRSIWSLHASAAMFAGKTIVFLGESGQGKSTLAAYLSGAPGWRLVADDILPVTTISDGVHLLPRFPQLKLPLEIQPGTSLPESLPLTELCVLAPAGQDTMPELQLLPPALAVQALLRHTAATRMFNPEMLGAHLAFCSHVSSQAPVYRLVYPHRKDALPQIKDLLEKH